MTGSSKRTLPRPSWQEFWRHPEHLLAFGFGTGYSPVAPGTVGSVVGLAAFVLAEGLGLGLAGHLLVSAIGLVAGVAICRRSSERLGVHDHPGIVWDEIVGCYLTCSLVPESAVWWGAAFGAFRAFDIIKPWPIRAMDHGLRGGVGIMLDDIVAALFAALSLHAVGRLGAFL
ncbi:MAG: phosphatidylglycerophosphatase A [Pseudomonadota bacterium]